jgi:hypothetical protein
MQCPQCGNPNQDGARFCTTCGGALATGTAAVIAAQPMGAAGTIPGAPATLRREDDRLIVPRGAVLPPYCVKCGQPATGTVTKNFGWHSPWLYLLIFAGLLLYAIVATIVMKRMKLAVPLCDEHRKSRKTKLTVGWGLLIGCIPAGFILGSMGTDLEGFGFLLGFAMFIASMVFLAMGSRLMFAKEITEAQATFTNVSPVFLDQIGAAAQSAVMGR